MLNQIASYTNAKNSDLDAVTERTNWLFGLIRVYPISLKWDEMKKEYPDFWNDMVVVNIENFCNIVNSIRFDFTDKKSINIVFPKITFKNLNIGNIIKQ